MARGEEDAHDPKRKLLTPPSRKPSRFDYRVLEIARGYYEATQQYPLNPRDVGNASLFAADMDWVEDLNLHMQWVKHKKDMLKRD